MQEYRKEHEGVLEEWEALKLQKDELDIQLKRKTQLCLNAKNWKQELKQALFIAEAADNEEQLLVNSQTRRLSKIREQANIEIQQTFYQHPAANQNQSMMINTFAGFQQPQRPSYQHQARPSGPPFQMTSIQQPQQRPYYGSRNATSH